jgi:two-component system chemotaxis response regulator CheB
MIAPPLILPDLDLQSGELYLARTPAILRTILGSCVAVTFWSQKLGAGALCHGILPICPLDVIRSSNLSEGSRYVDFSIRFLAQEFDALGASRREVQVKLFGGADVLPTIARIRPTVGAQNCVIAAQVLAEEGFIVTASDMGGVCGRRIHFHTGTGTVLVNRLAAWKAREDTENRCLSKPKIRVLIVDDSALVRQTLSEVLSQDPAIQVIATASDPYVAAERIAEQEPDVIILDIEMPRMDGLTFLQKIMSQHPIPVIICSTLADEDATSTLKALEYGAVDIVAKPRVGTKQFLEESRVILSQAVKAAAGARLRVLTPARVVEPKLTADAILSRATGAMLETTEKVVVIGASTGGTEALRSLLEVLPPDAPGIVIVQHMPEVFTRAFANRLDSLCQISVKEAKSNDTVLRGQALIAPGNHHLLLK